MQKKNEKPPSSLLFIEYLSLLSIFPILKVFWKFGSVSIYFLWFTGRGKIMTNLLRMIGIVNGHPIEILDASTRGDAPGAQDWDHAFRVLETCLSRLEQVEEITKAFFSAEEEEARIIMTNNIILVWSDIILPLVTGMPRIVSLVSVF